MTFGERIMTVRKKLKWSQDDLAKKVGTSAPIIGRYERNEIKPSIETAKNIADALEVTIDYLLGGTNAITFDKDTLKRIEGINSLDEESKNYILNHLDIMIRDFKARQAYGNAS